MKVVIDWPDRFHRLLTLYRQRSAAGSGQVAAELGPLYHLWLERHWRHSEFSFVQAAFDNYLAANYPLSRSVTRLRRYQRCQTLRDRFPYLTQIEAADRLGIIFEVIPRLVDTGLLTDDAHDPNQPQPRHMRVVRRSEFDKLQQRWQAGISFADVTRLFGVETQVVDDLVGAGMLTQHLHNCNGVAIIEKEALNTFVGKLHRYPTLPRDLGETV